MSLSARQKAFFLLSLRERPQDADRLFAFTSPEERSELDQLYGDLKGSRPEDLRGVAVTELKRLARPHTLNYLSEVHDDWLADLLKDESPALIAIVLRYLPAERVNALLESLPADVLRRLPRLTDTFAVDPKLVEILRLRFESLFELDAVPNADKPFSFEELYLLRAVQIRQIFQELGYREISLGLVTLPEMTKLLVLGRLLPEDRQRVDHYLKRTADQTPQRIKRAQVHLISREVNPREPGFFVKELGYLIYAKALLPRDRESLEILYRKMSRAEAKGLEDAIQTALPGNTEASVLPFREEVLQAAKVILGGRG